MTGFLTTGRKELCFGCEACTQACRISAIRMEEDQEGFRYPVIDKSLCVDCGKCRQVCPYGNERIDSNKEKVAFGGYHKDIRVRGESTSGGAFSAIVESWCDQNYVIFGASSDGLSVYHSYIEDKSELQKFRKSKYSQSVIGTAYRDAERFLKAGKNVLFSGTPCQISGLKAYLKEEFENLLTVEVICEGVPSPHFVRKYDTYLKEKYGSSISTLDYRYKDMNSLESPVSGKWDFEVMYTSLQNGKTIKRDRWFNPFWSIWLDHLMSRPSCYSCPFTVTQRGADITLGDLWGVHIYCPELYGRNSGASLIVCNTEKGNQALELAKSQLYGHELDFQTALKYQGPMRKAIQRNPQREAFLRDAHDLDYRTLCNKWAKKPSIKFLFSKYVYGNRQKVFIWNLKQKLSTKSDG